MWLDKLLNFLLRTKWGLIILFTSLFGCSFLFGGCMLWDTLACMCEGSCGEDNCFSECNKMCDDCLNCGGEDCALTNCLFGDGCLSACGNCTVDCGGCNRTCFTDCGMGCNDGCQFGNCTVDCSGNTATSNHQIEYRVYTEQGELVSTYHKSYSKRSKISLYSNVDTDYYQVLGFYKSYNNGNLSDQIGDGNAQLITDDNLNGIDTIYVLVSEKYLGEQRTIQFTVRPEELKVSIDPITVTIGGPIPSDVEAPTVEDYDFLYWELSNGTHLSKDFFKFGNIVHARDLEANSSATIKVIAVYAPKTYIAHFHLKVQVDGKYTDKEYSKEFSSGATLGEADNEYEKFFDTDYGKVVGWSATADPAPNAVPLPDSTRLEDNTHYYAIYQRYVRMTYHSYYGYDDNDSNKYVPEDRYYETQRIKLPKPDDMPIYTFDCWATAPQDGETYGAGEAFTITAAVTDLYARWTVHDQYTITYYDGSRSIGRQEYKYSETQPIQLNKGNGEGNVTFMTHIGYTFAGWCRNEDCTDTPTFTLPAKTYGDIKLYAKFNPDTYTINYLLGSGAHMDSTTEQILYGSSEGYQLKVPTREGYTFTGWYTVSDKRVTDGEGKLVVQFTVQGISEINTEIKQVQLQAHWTERLYNITFRTEISPGQYQILHTEQRKRNEMIGTVSGLSAPPKTGYEFAGWFEGDLEFNESIQVTKDYTFTAKFNPKKYQITLDAQGGTVNGEESTTFTVTYGEQTTLPIPTRAGKIFVGWYDRPSGGRQYTMQDGKLISPYTTDGTITLYARWL